MSVFQWIKYSESVRRELRSLAQIIINYVLFMHSENKSMSVGTKILPSNFSLNIILITTIITGKMYKWKKWGHYLLKAPVNRNRPLPTLNQPLFVLDAKSQVTTSETVKGVLHRVIVILKMLPAPSVLWRAEEMGVWGWKKRRFPLSEWMMHPALRSTRVRAGRRADRAPSRMYRLGRALWNFGVSVSSMSRCTDLS